MYDPLRYIPSDDEEEYEEITLSNTADDKVQITIKPKNQQKPLFSLSKLTQFKQNQKNN